MAGISFNTISSNIRTNTHHLEVDSSRAVQGLNLRRHVILVTGIKLATGTVAELVPKPILSGDQAEGFFGIGSMLAEELRAAKAANPDTEMWGIAIDELSGGTAQVLELTVTGTLTVAGTIPLYIAGVFVGVGVAVGDNAATIAAAIDQAITDHNETARFPVTTSVATNVVTLTKRWKGEEPVDVRFNFNDDDEFPEGITDIVVSEATPGAGNPDVGEIITAIGDVWYDTFIQPFNDDTNQTKWDVELDRRFGGMVQREAVAFGAFTGTHGAATTEGNGRNGPHVSIQAANESPTPSWIWAAVVGVVDAFEPDPARPRQTLVLPGILPAERTKRWTQSQNNSLLFDGMSTHVIDPSGVVTIERLITTFQVNSQNVPDVSFLNVTTMRTLAAIRFDRRSAISLSFPRHKLADDGARIPPGQPIVTPTTIKAHGLAQFERWIDNGWVESAALEQFKNEYIVIRDPADVDRIQEQMGPNLMNQFRGLSGQLQFLLCAGDTEREPEPCRKSSA